MIFSILLAVMVHVLLALMFVLSERHAAVPPMVEGTPLDDLEAGSGR